MSSGYYELADTSLEAVGQTLSSSPLSAVAEAEAVLIQLASVFFSERRQGRPGPGETKGPDLEARYRALVEQIPAIVFMAYLDRGIGEAYVSPQIEEKLGFTQSEWLEDPVRWYQQIHPKDKDRWSVEAATVFLTGKPLRSAYRVMARDGRVVWFHCEAKMVRRNDGRPWFIHGVAFDITEWKETEKALQDERNVVSAILNTVGALIVVTNPDGQIVRFNRACEVTTGYSEDEVKGHNIWDLFIVPEELGRFQEMFERFRMGQPADNYEIHWMTRGNGERLISWSSTMLAGNDGMPVYLIATGIDITEKKRLENSILEATGKEQRRIGQDLHDGLGQHLTGIAFMCKVQEQQLAAKGAVEAGDAAKIVRLVNEAILKTRELSRGLNPVLAEPNGLIMALQQLAGDIEDVFHVSCRFESNGNVMIYDENTAAHLFRIAQEAANNAVKHGRPTSIRIILSCSTTVGSLEISDNGKGLPVNLKGEAGMGLRIMNYRAGAIGGSLDLQRPGGDGTKITCIFPLRSNSG